MRNHEVTKVQKLLNEDGSLKEAGYSKSLIQVYNRNDIKVSKLRIKEWDYYLVLNEDFGIAATISDDGYIGLQSVSFLDFKNDFEHTETILNLFPLGKLHMPSSSKEGITNYQDKRLNMQFSVEDKKRILKCKFKNFYEEKDLSFEIILDEPSMDSMVIATPWKESKKAFYYNQKINSLRASGTVCFDNQTYTFKPQTDFGTLDWGVVEFGRMIILGIGVQEIWILMASHLDLILVMVLVIILLPLKTCYSMMELHIS